MSTVAVTRADDTGTRFSVTLRDDDGSVTSHVVSVSDVDWERFGRGYQTPDQLVRASFTYLLEHEPKESILRSFELNVIARYFPDFPATIARDVRDGSEGPR
jgi:hypothetical protein